MYEQAEPGTHGRRYLKERSDAQMKPDSGCERKRDNFLDVGCRVLAILNLYSLTYLLVVIDDVRV